MATFRLSSKVPDPQSFTFESEIILSDTLSIPARAMLVFLIVNSLDGIDNLIDHLLNRGLDTRENVESDINELVEAGYLVKEVE